MKYIKERLEFLKSDKMKKGDILVSRLIEHIKNDRSLLSNYHVAPSYVHSIITTDKIYYFEFNSGFPLPFGDEYLLKIYNKKDVADVDFPNFYKNTIKSEYKISREAYEKIEKLKSGDVKISKVEIPEKFLQDQKFVNDLEELSDEYFSASKYNL